MFVQRRKDTKQQWNLYALRRDAYARNKSRRLFTRVGDNAATVLDVMLEFMAEMLDEAAHRHRRRVAQRADRAALDFARHVHQLGQVRGFALPPHYACEHAVKPARTFA